MGQRDALTPNFVTILQKLLSSTQRPSSIQPPGFFGGKISARKYSVSNIEMKDLKLHMDMRLDLGTVSLENPPAFYHVNRVQIQNIGKKQGGVPLEELMMIVTASLVSAAIEAAPANIGAAITNAI